MAENSVFGLNSSFDSANVIERLVELQQRPIDLTRAKQAIDQQKLETYDDLLNRLQTFKATVNTINTENRFVETQGFFNNSDTSAVNDVVTINTTSTATSGTFSFDVVQLAKESKVVSQGFSDIGATLGSGLLSGFVDITVGETITRVKLDESSNTVDGLRLAINNSGAEVRATFLDDGDPDAPIKLIVSGTKTGVENSVSISVSQTGLPGAGGEVKLFDFTETQAAQDALLRVDGIEVVKSSNTVTDAIPGAILTLLGPGEGTLTLSSDISEIKEKINDFVEGFNDLMLFINDQLTLDETTQTTGILFGSFTVQNLQSNLRDAVSRQVQGVEGQFQFLSQIGIRTQSDGTLTIDDSTLTDALSSDIQNVTRLFASKGESTNSSVTFIGFTENTQSGTYDVRISNGNPQLSLTGQNDFSDSEGNGNFFQGAEGTPGEGLNYRIGSSVQNGTFGTIKLTLGVAEVINRILANQTDTSRGGGLDTEMDTLSESIKEFEKTVDEQEDRLVLFEENLRSRFTNLEIQLGQLESQRQAFTNSLQGLQSLRPNS